MMNDDLENIFSKLDIIEKEGSKTCEINDKGVFTYFYNTPCHTVTIKPNYLNCDDPECLLFTFPRNGDLLLYVSISGVFDNAQLYQYDFLGSYKIVYSFRNDSGIMNPFPYSGFPLLQCGKNIYLSIQPKSDTSNDTSNNDTSNNENNIVVNATYAFLDTQSRKMLATYTYPDGSPLYYNNQNAPIYRDGVKIKHENGDMYQVYNVCEMGYSPNILTPIDN